MRTVLTVVPALAGLAVVPSVHAEPPESPAIVVTATRTARTADDTLAAVSVLTRADIERQQPQDVLELLRTQAGIDLTRTGGPGANTSLFVRGTNSNHVLVLIDGVRAASASSGIFDWRSLPVAQIERIEIVRGPRSLLYGSDAIGGVIQIFTRRPKGTEAALGAGSYRSYRGEAGWGGGEAVRGSVYASAFDSRGFSAQNERGFSFDPDDDGYRNGSVSAALAGALSADTDFELRGWHSAGRVDFDPGTSDTRNQTVSARLRQRTTANWTQGLALGYAVDELETESFSASRFATRRFTADWQNDVTLGAAGVVTAGLAWVGEGAENVDHSTDTTLFDTSSRNRAAFLLWQARFGDTDVQLGARQDHYNSFGGHGSASVALGTRVSDTTRVRAGFGSGFRAPNANELYSPGYGGVYAGNPELDPERSRTGEIGLAFALSAKESLKLSVYDTRVKDLIAFQGTNFQAVNVDEARITGTELEYEARLGDWRHAVNLTDQRARDTVTDSALLYRPDQKAAYTVQRLLDRGGSAGVELLLVSERVGYSERLPGYGLVNLAAQVALAPGWFAEGRLENLLDKDYELVEGYNTPGLSVFAGVRYAPGR